MRQHVKLALFFLVTLLCILSLPAFTREIPPPLYSSRTVPIPTDAALAYVIDVVDGDTIDVMLAGVVQRIRYIGVDTPETVHPTFGEEPYGLEASAANRTLVEGSEVWLEFDVQEHDQYGRLLAYVYLPGGGMVNALLVELGYAKMSTWPPNVKYVDLFARLESEARCDWRGIWSGLSAIEHNWHCGDTLPCNPGTIPINLANRSELMLLPDIGGVRADDIITLREEDLFRGPEDLMRISGIGPARRDSLAPFVCFYVPAEE